MPENLRSLSEDDFNDFALLTEQESHSIDGQIMKMMLIEQMIRGRYEKASRAVELALRNEGLEGTAFVNALNERHQKIRIHRMDLGDGRFNLVVEKGDGDDEDVMDPSIYRVMIPAHIDTVKSDARMELEQDMRNIDRLRGLGVYDMGAAVLNNIALAVETKVPKGIKTYFVFTVDEEEDSDGARHLINQWDVWPHIDCVLSSEIGPVPPLPDGDPRPRIVTARTGRAKFIGNVSVDPRSQGHGAMDNLPDAGDALRNLMNRLEDRFYNGYADPTTSEKEPGQARTHPLLGKEALKYGEYGAKKTRSGYMLTGEGKFDFSIKMVPPSTMQEYVSLVRRWAKGIAKRDKWHNYGISYNVTQTPNLSSYAPYDIPEDHVIVSMVREKLEALSGATAEIVGAPSVADENDYAEDMLAHIIHGPLPPEGRVQQSFAGADKGVVTILINGDHAHHPDEWVSKDSIMRTREGIRHLLEDEDGFLKLQKQKMKN